MFQNIDKYEDHSASIMDQVGIFFNLRVGGW